jgi:hypothetical protein
MPPGQTTTSEVRVDILRFEHTNGQYGGADKTVAVDAVKEAQMMSMGQRRQESKCFLLDWQPIIWYKQEGRL